MMSPENQTPVARWLWLTKIFIISCMLAETAQMSFPKWVHNNNISQVNKILSFSIFSIFCLSFVVQSSKTGQFHPPRQSDWKLIRRRVFVCIILATWPSKLRFPSRTSTQAYLKRSLLSKVKYPKGLKSLSVSLWTRLLTSLIKCSLHRLSAQLQRSSDPMKEFGFTYILRNNLGNPQEVGQEPITFARQVSRCFSVQFCGA